MSIHRLGAHVSISGGYQKAFDKIHEMGGNTLQIFSASPRGWNFARPTKEDILAFKQAKSELGINPIFFHASYLINMADQDRIGKLSVQLLTHELKIASEVGVLGSIIHLGSYKQDKSLPLIDFNSHEKYQTLITNIKAVLEKTPADTFFIIENAGNRKIGQTIDEIAQIITDVNDKRVRVCLDTCHLHAAGYNLSDETHFEQFLQIFEEKIGLDKIAVWHVNDSRDPFGSLRDRHQNIGQGMVGVETFKLLLNHPKTRTMNFIIEVPGLDEKGPDKANLDLLKSFT